MKGLCRIAVHAGFAPDLGGRADHMRGERDDRRRGGPLVPPRLARGWRWPPPSRRARHAAVHQHEVEAAGPQALDGGPPVPDRVDRVSPKRASASHGDLAVHGAVVRDEHAGGRERGHAVRPGGGRDRHVEGRPRGKCGERPSPLGLDEGPAQHDVGKARLNHAGPAASPIPASATTRPSARSRAGAAIRPASATSAHRRRPRGAPRKPAADEAVPQDGGGRAPALHDHDGSGTARRAGGCAARTRSRGGERHSAEGRARTDGALDRDRPAHRLDQALADREAEPGAAEAARRRLVGLREGVEKIVAELVGRNADAGILARSGARRLARCRSGPAPSRFR